jgi:hypothetical protein
MSISNNVSMKNSLWKESCHGNVNNKYDIVMIIYYVISYSGMLSRRIMKNWKKILWNGVKYVAEGNEGICIMT